MSTSNSFATLDLSPFASVFTLMCSMTLLAYSTVPVFHRVGFVVRVSFGTFSFTQFPMRFPLGSSVGRIRSRLQMRHVHASAMNALFAAFTSFWVVARVVQHWCGFTGREFPRHRVGLTPLTLVPYLTVAFSSGSQPFDTAIFQYSRAFVHPAIVAYRCSPSQGEF